MPTRFLFAVLGFTLTLTACQDPSGVGLELIGEEGTDPNVVIVAADEVRAQEQRDVTGGFATSSPAQRTLLVGEVMDMLAGNTRAEGYFDFIPTTSVPEGFLDSPILGAELRLVRSYVYGDSMSTLPLVFYQIDETWSPADAPADTTFEVGAQLGAVTFPASDTLLTFDLPSNWISEFDTTIRSDSVISAIEGFQVRLSEGTMPNVVVGFEGPSSRLRLRTAQDTVDFPIAEIFSRIEREDPVSTPDGIRLLRDGSGEALAFTFPVDTLGTRAVASAALKLTIDTDVLDTGDGFTRPLPETLALYLRDQDDNRLLVTTAERGDTNQFIFTSSALTSLLQREVLGEAFVTQFEVGYLASPSTINVLPIIVGPEPAPGDPDQRPRFALTLVPIIN